MTNAVRKHTSQFDTNWYLPDLIENMSSRLGLDHRHVAWCNKILKNQPAIGLLRGPPESIRTAVRQGFSDQAVQSVYSLHSEDMIIEGRRSLGKPGW